MPYRLLTAAGCEDLITQIKESGIESLDIDQVYQLKDSLCEFQFEKNSESLIDERKLKMGEWATEAIKTCKLKQNENGYFILGNKLKAKYSLDINYYIRNRGKTTSSDTEKSIAYLISLLYDYLYTNARKEVSKIITIYLSLTA